MFLRLARIFGLPLVMLTLGTMLIAWIASPPAYADAVPVWTEHNDNARSGDNLSETILTPTNVNQSQFGQLFTYALDDQEYAQPLYMPNVTMAVDGQPHNVVFAATVNNSVYAWDAD